MVDPELRREAIRHAFVVRPAQCFPGHEDADPVPFRERLPMSSEQRGRVVTVREDRPAVEGVGTRQIRSEEHTSELQSRLHLVCRLLLEKKKTRMYHTSRC